MDYKRIYDQFIKDRRAKEPDLAGYVERHHILPRSLGGGDEPGNIVSLTPEDHFFAHLLLAKIHGGRMWAPIAFMLAGTRKDYRPVKSRKAYGWVRRALSANLRGEFAHQFDWSIYHLRHMDGREWLGRQSDMPDLGMSKCLANMLIKGRIKSGRGWYLAQNERPSRKGRSHHKYKRDVVRLVHIDGRKFSGTQDEFHLKHGVARPMVSQLITGKFRCAKGWYVEGRPPNAKTGRGAKYRKRLALKA